MRKILFLFCLLFSGVSLFADFPYDSGAEVDKSLNNTVQFGYRVLFFDNNPFIYFRDKDNPGDNLAQYNWKEQYWLYKSKGFDDSQIKLEKFYTKIDLSKTQLYRDMPKIDTSVSKMESENKAYDYSKDVDFGEFYQYLIQRKIPLNVIDFYLKVANNPAKRGKSVPFEYGKTYSASDIGIQPENLKLIQYKNLLDGEQMGKTQMITSGGMQYYFELKKAKYIRAVDWALNVFKDNKVVPLTVIELEPVEGMTGPKILRGAALLKRVKADLEKFTKKKFNVTLKTMKISYTDFANHGDWTPLAHYERFFDQQVHAKIPKNTLVIYYLTDRKRLEAIDKTLTHPLFRGPYGTDWERKYATIIHELGHSLGMRHHFNDEQTGSADINTHISPSCIMNYAFVKNEFCELCLYALGVK